MSENYLLNSLKFVGEVSVDHHDIVLFNYTIGASMMNNISISAVLRLLDTVLLEKVDLGIFELN